MFQVNLTVIARLVSSNFKLNGVKMFQIRKRFHIKTAQYFTEIKMKILNNRKLFKMQKLKT